jgi:2-dehydro-3-deoxygalactonokinase
MAASARSDLDDRIRCIVADWGTSNFRAWALSGDGAVLHGLSDPRGLLSVTDGCFAETFRAVCGPWLAGAERVPAILSGMIGSRSGWKEAPYLPAPVSLDSLAKNLCPLGEVAGAMVSIVPGISLDDPAEPDVMRGEEAQILGALHALGRSSGSFLLPGTHSKWAMVSEGRLTRFRTYMTGEVFGLMRKTGTIAQLVEGEAIEPAAFRRGVEHARAAQGRDLLHALFGTRAQSLLGRLPGNEVAGYLSGLLIGSELSDALAWLERQGKLETLVAIGAPAMLDNYHRAAAVFGLDLATLDSAAVLPPALFAIAVSAGLVDATPARKTAP